MGVDHILHRVGDDVTAGQGVEHTVVAHCNAVVDGNGVELSGIAAQLLNLLTYHLTNLMQMGMARHELSKRVYDGNNRLAKLLLFHSCGHPKGTGSSHTPTLCADAASQLMFHNSYYNISFITSHLSLPSSFRAANLRNIIKNRKRF